MSKNITIPTQYGYRDGLFDLDSLFEFAGVYIPFDLPAEIIMHAVVMGENEESDWYWIFEHDKQVYYARGGCDYSGWDCRSGGSVEPVSGVQAALQKAPEVDSPYEGGRPIRDWLKRQLDGEWQLGVIQK